MPKYRFKIGWIEGDGETKEDAFVDAVMKFSDAPDIGSYPSHEVPDEEMCDVCGKMAAYGPDSTLTDCERLVHDGCLSAHIGNCNFCGID